MPGTAIVTDSACDLTPEEVERHGIRVVPLSIRFGDEEFVDGVDLSVDQFYAKMASVDDLPETAAPAPGAFESAFRDAAEAGADSVVCINLSAAISATMQSAQNAARALEGDVDVHVVDSRSLTAGLGSLVLAAAAAAESGAGPDEIIALVDDRSDRTRVFGTLDTLENLKKGGRIGKAQALAGSVLAIKPVLDLSTGEVEEAAKARTRKKALLWLRDKVAEYAAEPGGIENLAVMDAAADDSQVLLDMLAEYAPDDGIRTGPIGAVVGTHGGKGTIGICLQVAS
ncbi:MAG: DegV family protein, partial [Actinomycetota bacterium]